MTLTIAVEKGTISAPNETPSPYIDWTGGAFPRLSSIDGDGSYGSWRDNLPEPEAMPWVTVEYGPGPAALDSCVVTVQARPLTAYPWDEPDLDENGHAWFIVQGGGPSITSAPAYYFREFYAAPLDQWSVHTVPCDLSHLSEFAADVAAGELLVTTRCLSFGYDISALLVNYDPARPLRWRQRNDGLGGSSPRAARGVTSQQGSNRHRGYL